MATRLAAFLVRLTLAAWVGTTTLDLCQAQPPVVPKRSPPLAGLADVVAPSVGAAVETTWERVGAIPEGFVPQGLAVHRGELVLTAHARDQHSSLFVGKFDDGAVEFQRRFDFPIEATHTSGIDFHPENERLMVCVDYNSDKIYGIDFVESCRAGRAKVLATSDAQLAGTSACCFLRHEARWRLIVTDFRNSGRNYLYEIDRETGAAVRLENSYRNWGFSQGIKRHGAGLLESGNLVLGSYVLWHDPRKALARDRIEVIEWLRGPDRGIEDIVVFDGYLYTTSEASFGVYRTKLPRQFDELR
ncbi:MAG: hypothetical protein U0939_20185 [Pirellulales bacterium]